MFTEQLPDKAVFDIRGGEEPCCLEDRRYWTRQI